MTYIEFFDRESIENICTCFAAKADNVIFIGKEKQEEMEKYILRYEKIFEDRGINLRFNSISVEIDDLNDIVNKITEVIENRYDENEDFVFDLTGGDDLFLVAMGIVFERFGDLGIQMHRFNLRGNKIIDCDADGNLIAEYHAPFISIEENIRVHGGVVDLFGNGHESFDWDMSDDFAEDIESMWAIIYRKSRGCNIGSWEKQIRIFEEIEACGKINGLTSSADKCVLKARLLRKYEDYNTVNDIIEKLDDYKLAHVHEDAAAISVTYKNEQVKRCLTKSGQALEMIVYLYALQSGKYNDVKTDVYIDWDGDLQTKQKEADTENEIDVMMMHGVVPVFVSCKNISIPCENKNKIDTDELYRLNAVAEKFGGKYAKKILVTTALDNGRSASYFRQRAKDMNIDLLEPLYLTVDSNESIAGFKNEISHAWGSVQRRKI